MGMLDYINSKIKLKAIDIDHKVAIWNFLNKKIVFTNGCFDLIHQGHVEYLAKASELGDVLVVGLNTDDSVKRIKGKNRPVNDENARANVLASMVFVDGVFFFDEDTPYELIKRVKPHILVKGADYNEEDIVGYDIVKAYNGEIKTLDLVNGYSTSNLIDKLKQI